MSKKKKIIIVILSCFLVVFFMTLFINLYIVNSSKSQIIDIDSIDKINDIDAIIILGCKAEENGPSLMLAKRLDRGYDVYNKLHTKIILTGDHGHYEYDEVNTMRDYLLEFDIPRKDIFLDHAGFSTYDSIYRAKYVFDAKKVVIVTQEYHMYRALYLANQLDLEAVGVVAEDIPQKYVMFKNNIREILSRDKNFFLGIFKPKSKYLGEIIPLNSDGQITEG